MNTTDDVVLPLVPLTVNPSDQSEVPHGTLQPEPDSSKNNPLPIINPHDGGCSKFAQII